MEPVSVGTAMLARWTYMHAVTVHWLVQLATAHCLHVQVLGMKDSLLPVADSKANSAASFSVCSDHVMKLVALLALLSTAATAIGMYCFQSGTPFQPNLTHITSSYMVSPALHLCIFMHYVFLVLHIVVHV